MFRSEEFLKPEKNISTLLKKNLHSIAKCLLLHSQKTVDVAQSVRASVCGAEGRGFEPHLPPITGQGLLVDFAPLFWISTPPVPPIWSVT